MTISANELRSVLRQYNDRMSSDRLARLLGDSVAPGILNRAFDIAVTRIAQTGPVHIYVDGWCKNNGKPNARAGWSIVAIVDGKKDSTNTDLVRGPQTNNVAEYQAFIDGLRWGQGYDRPIVIHTDSALVVGQMTKGWKVKAVHLEPLVGVARTLVELTDAIIVKEPREKIVEILGH